jgi:hypothetical protein
MDGGRQENIERTRLSVTVKRFHVHNVLVHLEVVIEFRQMNMNDGGFMVGSRVKMKQWSVNNEHEQGRDDPEGDRLLNPLFHSFTSRNHKLKTRRTKELVFAYQGRKAGGVFLELENRPVCAGSKGTSSAQPPRLAKAGNISQHHVSYHTYSSHTHFRVPFLN